MRTSYIYRITFLDTGHYYLGSRLCPQGLVPEEDTYLGSPSTHKGEWGKGRPMQKDILKVWTSPHKYHCHRKAVRYERFILTAIDAMNDLLCYNEDNGGGICYSKGATRFSGHKHTEESKKKISKGVKKTFAEHNKEQKRKRREVSKKVGKAHVESGHWDRKLIQKGIDKSAELGRGYMRKHWSKKCYEEIRDKFMNRTKYHWGVSEICKKYGITPKAVGNMLSHIKQGKTFEKVMGGF